jgi:DNA-binding transcriptional LysR family regulator
MTSGKHIAWDDLRLVKAIAEARSLPAAAAWIGVNHSTAFRRLKQIEDTLGTPLFEKHRSGYTLTAAGEEIAALAARVDEDVAAVTRKLAGQDVAPSGELRVATNDSLLIHLLTPLFAAFREHYPSLRLDILIGNQALNLAKRDADVAIRATDNPPENLIGRRAARIAWALYGRAGDFAVGIPREEAALREKNWVSLGEQLGALKVVKWIGAHIPAERVAYKVNTVLGLAEAVEAGAGIGHLPCFIGDARPALTRLAPPEAEFASDLWLLTHPDLRHSARVRVFLDFLAAQIAKRRGFIDGSGSVIER